MSDKVRPVEILLVEDNPGDAELTLIALEESKLKNNVHLADSGEKAIAFLTGEGEYADAPRPDLVILDLNLPGIDGNEVLQRIKGDPKLKEIPVVIMTTSSAEEDVLRSYRHHANCFITKPLDIDKFLKVVQSIEDFWMSIVVLPGKDS